ncbi:MAG: 2-C-methyl-D-erythritol 4-phosphate cytidylyltransferase [Actinomycetota bacterium]|nr:2-C-methyl-D-erythritol 4-phosphate cytidylyltransferase [Actinomycetota bacterium]
MSVVGIIPAGGSGERLGADRPKAFVVLAGRTLLEWSLAALGPACSRVVAAVPAGYEEDEPDRVTGGPSRAASVRNALAAAPEASVAVVHDAARPLVTTSLVRRCLAGLDEADGAVAARRVTDTVHEGDEMLESTLDRSRLWAAQTPQVFRADVLRRALEGPDATDEAAMVMAAGGTVRAVEAPADNIKVTTRLDLALAEALLAD